MKELHVSNPAYEVVLQEELKDLNSKGMLLRHKKSGARICLISNDDNNKVFCVGFRTIPKDSTGVPHIIEHTVLCGSDKFPLKDPFIELAKGSLNTFLNAITYPDKTIYPIASCNDKDFQNLMHVYMDAVFRPNIYKTENIFKQEGWHYELPSPEAELTINGVVYNEMKGAMSSAEEVVALNLMEALYPDTTYGVNAGGDPDVIPELTYEQYLDFHRTYYHPSNSYIYLYGDMDMEEKLAWLDEAYLSSYDCQPVDSEVTLQKPLGFTKKQAVYSVGEEEETENRTFLGYATVVGSSLDVKRCVAWDVLANVLLVSPGAPLKQALIDAGIGSDILCDYGSYIRQPYLAVIAKDASDKQEEQFLDIVRQTLTSLAKNGLNRKSLLGAINSQEFRYRESDYGTSPKGLILLLNLSAGWLYDDTAVFSYCHLNDVYKELREEVDTGYFEQLIREDFLESQHAVSVTVTPERGLTTKKEEALAKKLAAYKASLSKEEVEELVSKTQELRAYQKEETTDEQRACLPLLTLADLDAKVEPFSNCEHSVEDVTVVHHDEFTNGIAYINLLFDATDVPAEELPYLGLLAGCLGAMDTKSHTYLELTDEGNIHTGGIDYDTETFSSVSELDSFRGFLQAATKVRYAETKKALSLISETLTTTCLSDGKRLRELLAENCARYRMRFENAGHSAAVNRAMSYFSSQDYFNQQVRGIANYAFQRELLQDFDARKEEIVAHLTGLLSHIIKKERLIVSVTGESEGFKALAQALPGFFEELKSAPQARALSKKEPYPLERRNEGFTFAGQVQYLARCGNFKKAGVAFTGAIRVMRTILSLDYLWTNIRVLGGAYGCMCEFNSINGNAFFVSYRDPKLAQTNDVFEKAADYIASLPLSEREMTKYIIGTISNDVPPLTPKLKGSRAMNLYLTGYTLEDLQRTRNEILSTTEEDVHKAAEAVRAFVAQNYTCVVGSEATVRSCSEMFQEIKPL